MTAGSSTEAALPPFPIAVWHEPQISPQQDRALCDLIAGAFGAQGWAAFGGSRHWHGCRSAYTVVHERDGVVLGSVAVVFRTLRCGETAVDIAGVQNMGVVPSLRKTGLSQALLARAMDTARSAGRLYGFLFCLPALEKFYGGMGWVRTDARCTMDDEQGHVVPITDHNIAMYLPLSSRPFPPGDIYIGGRDW